ncbi:glycosyltransferase [Aeromonas caviae]|uniref:glycosyltransferase n=1 Tax=Aeromonas caviae TaxID=648 RepID=UPI0034425984
MKFMQNHPLVSVIITTYNREHFLERAIISVSKQDYSNIELIISDDCSNYDVEKQVTSLCSKLKIKMSYRRNNCNRGACYTRNEAIKMAGGYFIAGLDDDDEFEPNRISYLVENYDEQYSFIASNTTVVTSNARFPLFKSSDDKVVLLSDYMWENIVGTQCLVRKDRIIDCGGFDVNLSSAQDADMWFRLIERYGPALRLGKSSYLLHVEHEEDRISTSKNKLKGLIAYNSKHLSKMSPSQVSYAKFKIKLWENNRRVSINALKELDFGACLFLLKKIIVKMGL